MKKGDTVTLVTPVLSKRRVHIYSAALGIMLVLLMVGVLSRSFHYAYISTEATPSNISLEKVPFPLGVDPHNETIIENPAVDLYLTENLSGNASDATGPMSLIQPVLGRLALLSWYQNLASISTRILVVDPGERKEEIAQHFARILGWSDDEKREFLATVISLDPIYFEGKFAPGTYVVNRDAKPQDVALLISERFNETVLARYPKDIETVVSLADTLTIASLLEREGADFNDMRYISGIIWNRLFIDMKLQIDATLQYAKGERSLKTWWPKVNPEDKYIESAYNTYQHKGLPPTPIASPSANAILAALNPRQTDCLYYFHDRKANFHCSKTYEEHVVLLKEYYGRGK